jgi:hypothetical protein
MSREPIEVVAEAVGVVVIGALMAWCVVILLTPTPI